jgi:methionine-rich copper-binding protein CopC
VFKPLHIPIAVATVTVAVAFPQIALAHALLVASSPQANSVVHGSQLAISLKFDSRVDASRSLLTLVAPDGRSRTLTQGNQAGPSNLNAQAESLKPGAYTIRWQALSSDGHITRGEIPFRVE